jgi:hypothetical protein
MIRVDRLTHHRIIIFKDEGVPIGTSAALRCRFRRIRENHLADKENASLSPRAAASDTIKRPRLVRRNSWFQLLPAGPQADALPILP